jgi:uncharacterized protein YneR
MVKQIALIFLLFPFLSKAQSWTFNKGDSPFDGTYKTSKVAGKGTDFSYKNPILVINKFDVDNKINFYVKGAGFFQENKGLSISWVFNNEKNIIYDTPNFSLSDDGKTIFFEELFWFESRNEIGKNELILKLQKANYVNLRISDNYGSNELIFYLKGSTKAINYVLGQKRINEIKKQISSKRNKLEQELNSQESVLNKLMRILKRENFTSSSLNYLESEIKDNLGIGIMKHKKPLFNIDSIRLEPNTIFFDKGYVDLYYISKDNYEEKTNFRGQVKMNAPIYERFENEKTKQKEELIEQKMSVKALLSKYYYNDIKDFIFRAVLKEQQKASSTIWKLSHIEDITTTISTHSIKYFWNLRIVIHLSNKTKLIIDDGIYSKQIQISKLNSMGWDVGIEF